MRVPHASQRLIATLLTALGCACQAPEPRAADQVPVAAPAEWHAQDAAPGKVELEGWWRHFEDSRLDALVADVLANNHDLIAASARIDAARAQARVAGASLQPSVGVGGNGARRRQNFVGLPLPGGGVLSSTSNTFGVSLDISWELDLWGKLDAHARAADADLAATTAQSHGVQLSLAGQAVKAWFALAEAKAQRELAERRVASFEQTTEVMRNRYRQGRIEALDMHLAEAQLSQAKAVRAAQRSVIERVSRQIEILAGGYPEGTLAPAAALPRLPDPVPAGLPSELLQRRPDLVAALEGLRASDYRLFEARKQLWPSLSLSASGGRSGAAVGDLLDGDFNVWSLVGNLTQPVFQGGRLRAGVDLADARVRESLANYSQAILTAFSEVEIALATERSLTLRESELADATRHAGKAEEIAEERYLAGRHDILSVLTARRQSFDNESAHLSVQRERLDRRVDLYLALGGGFGEPHDDGASDERNVEQRASGAEETSR